MMVPSSVHAVISSISGQEDFSMTKLWYLAATKGLTQPLERYRSKSGLLWDIFQESFGVMVDLRGSSVHYSVRRPDDFA